MVIESEECKVGVVTIADATTRYAPATENDPAAYSRYLLKKTDIPGDLTLRSLAGPQFGKLLTAIQSFQGWKEGKIAREPAS